MIPIGKDLLTLEGLSRESLAGVLDTAASFKEVSRRAIKKVPTLRGRTVATLFFEPSTRTRLSFELAAKRLSADVISFSVATSSVQKKESVVDTIKTIEAMGVDLFVVRHAAAGTCHQIARLTAASVLNAGDGAHAHPTQALLDMLTIRDHLGRLDGLKVVIVGDVAHSRVVRSNVIGLTAMGARVVLVAPPTLMPPRLDALDVAVTADLDGALEGADVVMALRLQLERQQSGLLPSIREYTRHWQLNAARVARLAPHAIVMHPGPMNRGVEIAPDVADGHRSVITRQVTNGIAVRMALLYLLLAGRGGVPDETAERPQAS